MGRSDELVKKVEDLKTRAVRGDCPDDVDECDPGNCEVCFMDAVLRLVKGETVVANKTRPIMQYSTKL